MSYPILWRPAATNYRTPGRSEPIRAIVNHRMVGTLAGTTAFFQNPDHRPVSTHFGIGKIKDILQIHQYVYLDDTAYGNGNYDSTGTWDNWGFKTTEINAQTISIEHQDHYLAGKGVVPADVQEASIWLQALVLRADEAEWEHHNLNIRSIANFPSLQRELRAIPIDGHHIITHHDIAGRLKPYCWLPWAEDNTGFPRTKYVREITALVGTPPTTEEPFMLDFYALGPADGIVTIKEGRGLVSLVTGNATDPTTEAFPARARIALREPYGGVGGEERQKGYLVNLNGQAHIALDDVVAGFVPTPVPTIDPNPELFAELEDLRGDILAIRGIVNADQAA